MEQLLARLQSESRDSAIFREQIAFDCIAGPCTERLVLCGCGDLGQIVLQGLRKVGIEPLAFADNDPAKAGTAVCGVPVISVADAICLYNDTACFVVTVFRAVAMVQQLQAAWVRRIAEVPALFWKYPKVFTAYFSLPHEILDSLDKIEAACNVLGDFASRHEMFEQIAWSMNPSCGTLPAKSDEADIYFPADLFELTDREVFVDAGAYDGDTVREFLRRTAGRGRVHAIEPDVTNLASLRRSAGAIVVGVYAVGLSDHDGVERFDGSGTVWSSVMDEGDSEIQCAKIDSLFAQIPVTFIKMDIEGSEPRAIAGAAMVMQRDRPVVAACAYHKGSHLWEIPLLFKQHYPEAKVFLRRYAVDCWETVYYAIPPERLK